MLITSDPISKKQVRMHTDGAGYAVESKQDITDIVARNKHLYNTFRGAWESHGEWGDMVASIPANVWGELMTKGIAYDEKRLRKWLDDRDQLVFRTRPGSLSK
jgi:hypothetical protein